MPVKSAARSSRARSEEHTSELQSHSDLVCRLLLEKKKDPKSALGNIKPRNIMEISDALLDFMLGDDVYLFFIMIRHPPISTLIHFFLRDTAPPNIYPLSPPDAPPS